MPEFSIAVIPGDGIGQEVTPAALAVLNRIGEKCGARFDFTEYDWGTDYYFRQGRMAPEDFLEKLRPHQAILLGAVGHPEVQDNITLNGLLLPIRRTFDQYVCERPAKLVAGVPSPLQGKQPGEIDLVVVRENTEGEYAQIGGPLYVDRPSELAVQTSVFTRMGCERIIRHALELARKRGGKKRVSSITKSNAQGYSMTLWDRVFAEVAEQYPDVETEKLLVDAASMAFVNRPESFDVVVGSNLFGDILSDLAAAVVGGIGLAASSNVDPTRKGPSMFEPVHGSAPDIAGQGVANPLAMILSAAMMLDFLGLEAAAREVQQAVEDALGAGDRVPRDLGGRASTDEAAQAVLDRLG